jgi:hypothetical protein
MISLLLAAAEELREMEAAGVMLVEDGVVGDDYAVLTTANKRWRRGSGSTTPGMRTMNKEGGSSPPFWAVRDLSKSTTTTETRPTLAQNRRTPRSLELHWILPGWRPAASIFGEHP